MPLPSPAMDILFSSAKSSLFLKHAYLVTAWGRVPLVLELIFSAPWAMLFCPGACVLILRNVPDVPLVLGGHSSDLFSGPGIYFTCLVTFSHISEISFLGPRT
jgi:hypothetical protein